MTARQRKPDLQVAQFKRHKDWTAWLAKNHAASPGVWLCIAKASSGVASVTYAEALETALCYGWIDGQKKTNDALTWLQKFTPRGDRSIWSKINRGRAETLMQSGRMQPAGLQAVRRAQQNGRWGTAYDSPRQAGVPSDLEAALDRNPKAKAFFATLNRQNRYAILHRVQTAKKAATRAKRIAQFVSMLAAHEKLYP